MTASRGEKLYLKVSILLPLLLLATFAKCANSETKFIIQGQATAGKKFTLILENNGNGQTVELEFTNNIKILSVSKYENWKNQDFDEVYEKTLPPDALPNPQEPKWELIALEPGNLEVQLSGKADIHGTFEIGPYQDQPPSIQCTINDITQDEKNIEMEINSELKLKFKGLDLPSRGVPLPIKLTLQPENFSGLHILSITSDEVTIKAIKEIPSADSKPIKIYIAGYILNINIKVLSPKFILTDPSLDKEKKERIILYQGQQFEVKIKIVDIAKDKIVRSLILSTSKSIQPSGNGLEQKFSSDKPNITFTLNTTDLLGPEDLTFKYKYNDNENKNIDDIILPIQVNPIVKRTVINGPYTLLQNEYADYTVEFYGEDNRLMNPPDTKPIIKLSDEGIVDYKWSDRKEKDKITLTVRGRKPGDTFIQAELRYPGVKPDSLQPEAEPFTLGVRAPSSFSKLRVKLQVMDEATAEKAFGHIARRDYYVVQVMMFNNLDPAGPDASKSILAYSDTIETKVYLEKQGMKIKNEEWEPVTETDYASNGVEGEQDIFNTKMLIKTNSGASPPNAECMIVKAGQSGVLVMRPGERRNLDIVLQDNAGKNVPMKSPPCISIERKSPNCGKSCIKLENIGTTLYTTESKLDHDELYSATITCNSQNDALYTAVLPIVVKKSTASKAYRYRPYVYDLVVNTFEDRAQESSRATAFKVLEGLSTIASFVSALKRPSVDEDLPYFTDKYSNLLLPAFRRLFPDQKDTQRQNTVNMLMRPVEEIPYGANISRVLFFPKRFFTGYLKGYRTRISAIDTGFFEVDVAVIDKRERQQAQQ